MLDNVKTPVEMIEILPDEKYRDALAFVNLGNALNCKAETRYAHSNKYWRCVFSRKKPSRVLFTVECTEEWWRIKACLWNIDRYRDSLNSCGENTKKTIINAYNCKSCNDHCKGGASFSFDGKEYRKCIGCCFYFPDMDKAVQNDLLLLISKEYEATGTA